MKLLKTNLAKNSFKNLLSKCLKLIKIAHFSFFQTEFVLSSVIPL